jgi:hypothetical protein
MGKIQCVSLKSGNIDIMQMIERGLINKDTPLDKKISEEYKHLKEINKNYRKVKYLSKKISLTKNRLKIYLFM